ncbi:MAG: alpha-amylase family glycosyl hydrolase [Chitinophagales bacterium]
MITTRVLLQFLFTACYILCCFLNVNAQQQTTPFNKPPEWSKQVIWYQIFVERFYNGDRTNDPRADNINVPPINVIAPPHWAITPWTHNWYAEDNWAHELKGSFNDKIQYRRYGGDLQGVLDMLDYLQDLGITALFLNPVNDAPSLHKYDATNYHHVDVNFGPDPDGDRKIIAGENPLDPSSWKWTAADKLFLMLVEEVHKRNMKIIMDYSWNHTGTLFWAWQDILKNQEKSPYKNWYEIKSFDDPATAENEFTYRGWAGTTSLVEWKKVNITTPRKDGHPYEGDLDAGVKKHIFDVTKRWLAPDGDVKKGIDGYRLDVADQVGLSFWRDFRKLVRSVNPDAYLVGEIWWEEWPDKLMNPAPYTSGGIFDAVMQYQVYRPARYFFADTNYGIDAAQFKDSLTFQWSRLPEDVRYAMMNVSSSHDAPRLLTDFYNPNKYKFHATPSEDKNYKTGKPDADTYQRVRLYLVHLFTNIGAPQVYNGEEMGMWTADDPARKPLMWKEFNFEPEFRNNFEPKKKSYDSLVFNQQQFDWYKKMIAIRKSNPVLATGAIEFLTAEGKKLAYRRFDKDNEIIVLFNVERTTQQFDLPKNSRYVDLLTDRKFSGSIYTLNEMSAAILKRVD